MFATTLFRMIRMAAIVCLLMPSSLVAADKVQVLYDNDQAVALTRKTGRPLLAIGGTTSCPYCVKMAKALESDTSIADLASRFVILKIDTSSALWREWKGRYEVEGEGVPQVIILRGDGHQLYGKVGSPTELKPFLESYLGDAGTVLDNRQLEDLDRLLKEAQKAVKRKDYPKAIELAQECTPKNCYASVVAEAKKLLDNLTDRSRTALKEAEKKLKSRDKQLEGAIALLELDRQFAELKSAHGEISDSLTAYKADETKAELFTQAEPVLAAQKLDTTKNRTEALAAWKEIASKFPETPASTLAARRIADLEKRLSGSKTASKTATGGDPNKKAISQLSLGKQLLRTKPADAREYLERVIELAPESEAADEARELLESLD